MTGGGLQFPALIFNRAILFLPSRLPRPVAHGDVFVDSSIYRAREIIRLVRFHGPAKAR